ncbi:organic cation transporter protein-like protein [Euroglyphus maynei]|uniref:Organic cation transporter protein-like protein n=1 Tax=Euroglyphus maynei TaxID=6958 RepID=A0A1Y3B9B5_EURMA|nr:organic cation transporter protein-like protein [Euroglyphus maynei]
MISLLKLEDDIDFWRRPDQINRFADLMITPNNSQHVIHYLSIRNIDYEILIDNVRTLVQNERDQMVKIQKRLEMLRSDQTDITAEFWQSFQRFDAVENLMNYLQNKYPNLVEKINFGKSFEGRELNLLRIGANSNDKKPVVFIEGGIHAREWISTAFVTHFANQLLLGYNNQEANIKTLMETFDFYIVPLLNPDGYEHTHTKYRLWRKTRSTQASGSCIGADPNRNFGYEWGGEGTSTNPCSEIYPGKKPFSEPEVKAETDYIMKNLAGRALVYVAVHSYGQYLLYPWGWTNKPTPDNDRLNSMAKVATDAMAKRYESKYIYGMSTTVLYAASGAGDDWAYGEASIPYSYTLELRDKGSYGFQLPPEQIIPTSEEAGDDFWQQPTSINDYNAKIMITQRNRVKVFKYLQNRQIQFKILHSNVETLIENERNELIESDRLFQSLKADFKDGNKSEAIVGFWIKYHRYKDIDKFMNALSKNSDNLVKKFILGKSFERKPIYSICIGNSSNSRKPVIYIQGGIHAREWISPAVVTYFAQQLVNGVRNSNPSVIKLMNTFDFYITPVLNVDGYEYTHEKNRLWRKTRSTNWQSFFRRGCRGVDANRNYDYDWAAKGISANPCSETYAGDKAFSEPETRAEAEFLLKKLGKRVQVYIAVHSYGQLWLYPWGNVRKDSPYVEKLSAKAKIATDALYQRYKTRFKYGNSAEILYAASGAGDDWAHGKASIPYVYTVELRDRGDYGFLLPPNQIQQSGEEITDAFMAMFLAIKWLRSFSQSMYQLGYVFSGIIIAWISDQYGRKFALQISIAFELLGGLLLILSPSIHLYTLARLILGFGDSGRGMCLYMLLMETVGTRRRSDVIMGCNFGWIVGYLLLPIIAYILHNYVLVQLLATMGMTVMAVFWLPYLPESPRWLIANEKYERAKSILQKACKRNNRVEEFEYKFESLKNKATKLITTGKTVEEHEQQQSDGEKFMTLWSMVTHKKYCMMTLILWFSFFVNGFIYHGFSLNVEIIGGNVFINFALAGLVEIPSVVISLIGMRYIGRKAFIISTIVSAAFCYATIATFRILWANLSDNDIMLVSLSMLGKMFIFATFNAIYIHAGEIFPTKLRQSGVSSCSISARAGSTIAPFVKDLVS